MKPLTPIPQFLPEPAERSHRAVWPRVTGAILIVHGVAHMAGAGQAFDAFRDAGSLDYLGGAWAIRSSGLVVLFGVAWALVGLWMVTVGVSLWWHRAGWHRALVGVVVASTLLTLVGLWASWVGVVINAALATLAARRDLDLERGEEARYQTPA